MLKVIFRVTSLDEFSGLTLLDAGFSRYCKFGGEGGLTQTHLIGSKTQVRSILNSKRGFTICNILDLKNLLQLCKCIFNDLLVLLLDNAIFLDNNAAIRHRPYYFYSLFLKQQFHKEEPRSANFLFQSNRIHYQSQRKILQQ